MPDNARRRSTRTRLRFVHGTCGLLLHFLAALLVHNTDSLLYAGHPTGTPILAILVMCELLRSAINLRWLNVTAEPKYVALPGQNSATRAPSASARPRRQLSLLAYALLTLGAGVACAYAVCILFGAPLLEKRTESLTLAVMAVSVSLLPLILFAGPLGALQFLFCDDYQLADRTQTAYLQLVQRQALCALFGAWASSACSVLDWDRDWQAYPVPNVVGLLLGLMAGNAYTVLEAFGRTIRRRLQVAGILPAQAKWDGAETGGEKQFSTVNSSKRE